MDDREKLFEIIDNFDVMSIPTENFRHGLAEFLISNGVTVMKKGKWGHLGGDEWVCTSCGNVIYTEGSWEKPTQKFCDECGADMRGAKNNG